MFLYPEQFPAILFTDWNRYSGWSNRRLRACLLHSNLGNIRTCAREEIQKRKLKFFDSFTPIPSHFVSYAKSNGLLGFKTASPLLLKFWGSSSDCHKLISQKTTGSRIPDQLTGSAAWKQKASVRYREAYLDFASLTIHFWGKYSRF